MDLRAYYKLTKPGIIYGNLFVAVGAFFLAAGKAFEIDTFVAMFFGLGMIVGSAGVLNNYYDRDIDAKMERTRTRPSVTGEISGKAMITYGATLALVGSTLLFVFVNSTATMTALFGWFAYLFFYTLLSKRGSSWGTFIGGLSGAMPPVVGYVAVTASIDTVALVLLLTLFFWQMPHAYAIALFRFDDYKAANLPVLPVAHGITRTKIEILTYAILFSLTTPFLFILGATGRWYLLITSLVSLYWLFIIKKYWKQEDFTVFGKKVFLTSLIVLTTTFVMMSIDTTRF
jgi:protoheme IX farnesyltransferase